MDEHQKPYDFIKEVIKEKKLDKKTIGIRIGIIVGAAVLFGVVAAFTFSMVRPFTDSVFQGSEEPPKVDIPTDQVPTPTPETDVVTDSSDEADEMQVVTEEDPIEDYKELYQEMRSVAKQAERSMVTVNGITNQMDYFNATYEQQKQLSGLLLADNGQELFVLTEYRVVENVQRIQITFWDGSVVDGIYQTHDSNTGLAILKVARSDLSQETREGMELAPLGNSYGVTQGEPVVAIGSPMGYTNSVAYGFVTTADNKLSAIDVEYTLLTTDIMGSKDGSGVLINLDGEIIGILVQGYSADEQNSVTAVAISRLKTMLEKLSNNEKQNYIGIKGQDVIAQIADKTGIPRGVLINSVQGDSPAMMSGLKEYDVIVKFDGEKITTMAQYQDRLSKCEPGQVVEISAMRKGAEGYVEVPFEVTIGER